MNGHQRISAALNGEMPDKRPVMLHNFMAAAQEAGINMREYREDPQLAAQAHIDFVEKYDLDGILIDVDTSTLAGALGVPVDFPDNEPARTTAGCLHPLEKVKDLRRPTIAGDERIQIWLEICRIVKKYFGEEKYVRGNCDQAPFSLATMVRGTQNLMLDLVSEKKDVFKLLEYCTEAVVQFIDLMAETQVDMVSNGDSPAGPEMISPDMYKTFAMPYEERIIDAAHHKGLSYALHICGDTELILDYMQLTGTDALELDFKTNIEKIYTACSENITLIGTIDPVGVLTFGTPDNVEKEALELLSLYENSPRFIMNAGCAMTPHTPSENIKRLINITHSF